MKKQKQHRKSRSERLASETVSKRDKDVPLLDRRFDRVEEARTALIAAGYRCGFVPAPAPDLWQRVVDGEIRKDNPLAVGVPKKGDKKWRIVAYPMRLLIAARKSVDEALKVLAKRRAKEEARKPKRVERGKAADVAITPDTKLRALKERVPKMASRQAIQKACKGEMTVKALCKTAKTTEKELAVMLKKRFFEVIK